MKKKPYIIDIIVNTRIMYMILRLFKDIGADIFAAMIYRGEKVYTASEAANVVKSYLKQLSVFTTLGDNDVFLFCKNSKYTISFDPFSKTYAFSYPEDSEIAEKIQMLMEVILPEVIVDN